MIMKNKPINVLLVDDDENFKLYLSQILTDWGHQIWMAENGNEALRVITKEPIEIVISDWMMPEMDGIRLCQKMRDEHLDRYIYFILLTAKDNKGDIIEGRDSGADDYIVKSYDPEELRVCLNTGIRILSLQRELKNKNRALQWGNDKLNESYELLHKDLEAAAQAQLSLLPSPCSTGTINFEWLFMPTHFVAGDIFNYYQLDEDNFVFYSIDVSGHGVSSAMLSVSLSQILSPYRFKSNPILFQTNPVTSKKTITPPDQVMKGLNQRFQITNEDNRYFTMMYGIINIQERTVSISQAGHPPLLILRDKHIFTVGKGGFPIGLIPDADFHTLKFNLLSGDRLFLHSDGLIDCLGSSNTLFDQNSFQDLIIQSHKDPLNIVVKNLETHIKKANQGMDFKDDISLLAMEIN